MFEYGTPYPGDNYLVIGHESLGRGRRDRISRRALPARRPSRTRPCAAHVPIPAAGRADPGTRTTATPANSGTRHQGSTRLHD